MPPEKLKVRPVTEIYGFSIPNANAGGGFFSATHNKAPLPAEVDSFYEKLISLYESSGLSLLFNFRETSLDLHMLYKEVTQRGGLHQVAASEKWGEIASIVNSKCKVKLSTNQLQRIYGMILYQYEQMFHYRSPFPKLPKSPGHRSDKGDGASCSASKRKEYFNAVAAEDFRTFKRKCNGKTKQLTTDTQNKPNGSPLSAVVCGTSKDGPVTPKKSDENTRQLSTLKHKERDSSRLALVLCGPQDDPATKSKCDDSNRQPKQKQCDSLNLAVVASGTRDDPTAQKKCDKNSELLPTVPRRETEEAVEQTPKTKSDDTSKQPSTGKKDGCDSSRLVLAVVCSTKDDDTTAKQANGDYSTEKTTGSKSIEEKQSLQTPKEASEEGKRLVQDPKEANAVHRSEEEKLAQKTPEQAKSVPPSEGQKQPEQLQSVPKSQEEKPAKQSHSDQKQPEKPQKEAKSVPKSQVEKPAMQSPKEAKATPKSGAEKPVMKTPKKGKSEKKPYVRTPKKDKEVITKEKDPNAPTKPRSGYQLFISYECNRLKSICGENSGNLNIRDMAIQKWRSLSLEDRKPYLEEHKRDKERFDREMIMYKEQKSMLCFQQDNPGQVISNYPPEPAAPPVFVPQNPRPVLTNYSVPYPTMDGDYHVTLQPPDLDKYSMPDENALEVAIGLLKNVRSQNDMLFQMDWDGYDM